VRTGEEELFKARAKEKGSVKLIDLVRARLDAKRLLRGGVAEPALKDVRINDDLVRDNERMLTDGFYAEVTLSYDGLSPSRLAGARSVRCAAAHPDVEIGCGRYAGREREKFTTPGVDRPADSLDWD
jgi:ATP-dependent Lon protease